MAVNMTASINVEGMERKNAMEFRASLVKLIRVIEDEHKFPTVLIPTKRERNKARRENGFGEGPRRINQ